MKPFLWAILFTTGFSAAGWGQVSTAERTVRVRPGVETRVGIYVNVNPDCTSGALPTIRLSEPPQHGRLIVKTGKITATNYKQCLALQVPGYIAFYRPGPNFSADDKVVIEVKYPNGRTEIQRIKIIVSATGQNI